MKKGFRILKFKKDAPIFEVKDLSKSFDGRPILKKLSLKIFPGECVGLLGPNGAGKTTLFSICIGEEDINKGKVYLNNKSIEQIPIHLRANAGLGYLPQSRSLFNLSVYDNIAGLVEIFIKDSKKRKDEVEKILSEFNLTHLRSLNASTLSGGEAKRLQISRLMINRPKVILMDEPFSALDPVSIQDIQKYIFKIQSMGISILISDHNINTLFSTTDRNYCIYDGTIIAEGTKKELLSNTKAVSHYFGSSFDYK